MTVKTIQYLPGPIPKESNQVPSFLEEALGRLGVLIGLLADGHLDVTNVAPPKPKTGDIRFADGTNWNPGAGRGIYYFDSTWVLL